MSNYKKGEEYIELEFGAVIIRIDKSCGKLQNLDCIYRKKCLDYASEKRWQGFSCEKCPYRKNEVPGKTGAMPFLNYQDITGLPVHCELPSVEEDWKI